MTTPSVFDALADGISRERAAVVDHPVYATLRTTAALRVFMATHVFAVWDFMSLLKTLQGTAVPWLPPADAHAARLVNEMVLAEESDEVAPGRYQCHFELYLDAMDEVGADTRPVRAFVERLRASTPIALALAKAGAPPEATAFVLLTLATCECGTAEIAASFVFGREVLVPAMFREILADLAEEGAACPAFRPYLERHVELDGEQHGPMARLLLESVCGDDASRWRAATAASRTALEARRALWDGLLARSTGSLPPLPVHAEAS